MQELVEYGPNLLITEVLSIILTVYLFEKCLDAFILG
jgi:hypothetical protein